MIAVGVGMCRIGDGILGGGDAKGLFSRSGRRGIGEDDNFDLSSPGMNHLKSVIWEPVVEPSSPLVDGTFRLEMFKLGDPPSRNGEPCGEKWGEPRV